jgi:gluconokinase
MGSLVLAIDVGTSSVRSMVFDSQGKAMCANIEQVRYTPETTPDGGSMLDPQQITELICQCIDQILAQAGSLASEIGTVVMDTLVTNVLGIDKEGTPTTPVYTWADIRGASLVGTVVARLPQDYTQRTGCRAHTSYWPVRLSWLKENEPQRYQRTAYWLSIGEYLLYQLFGARQVSYSVASWTGLFNRHKLMWDEAVLEALSMQPDQFSVPSMEPCQGLSGRWAARWPTLKDARWFPAIGDGVASNIGAGCTRPQHVALSIGTSGAIRVIVPGTPERTSEGLFVYRVDASRSLVGGALSNAGNLYAWMQQTLNIEAVTSLEAVVAAMEPDSHGLTILPFLAGERAPGWNDKARAVMMGMTFNTGPEHLIRAGLEAIAYRFYQVARRLSPPKDAVYVANGAAILNSPTWMQIIADVLNAPVLALTELETTIRGAVYLATGHEPEPHTGDRYTPDAARHEVYQAAIARQAALYERLFS